MTRAFGAGRPYDARKRAMDVLISTVGLLVTAPIQAITAALVAYKLGRPVLFKQERPGLGGQPYINLKFRSMLHVDPAQGLVTDEERLTDFGRALRSTSLDELPSLWNVLRGDMSIVGPRPLMTRYLDRYTLQQARRHEVRPGITGLAQINGRNNTSWDDRLNYDVEYVDSRSLRLDLYIIVRTVRLVFRREGVSADGYATMQEFTGDSGLTSASGSLGGSHI